LPCEDLVLGVEVGSDARAYPLLLLHREGPVVYDTLGGRTVVVLARPGSWLCAAFEPTAAGRRVQLRAGAASMTLEDVETGTAFDLTGTAVSGPLAGHRLPFVVSGLEKWGAWAASHPTTDIHGAAGA
jgi:hypothetical protein